MFPKFKRYHSPINGTLYYSRGLFGIWDVKLGILNGYEHSGWYMEKMWRTILTHYKHDEVKHILILGSGAGCSTYIAHKFWPKASIDSVDYDSTMFTIEQDIYGTKGLGIRFTEQDALEFLHEKNNQYDMILVDLFAGEKVSELLQSKRFSSGIHKRLTSTGNLLINIYNQKLDSPLAQFLQTEFPDLVPQTSLYNTVLVTPTRSIPEGYYDKSQSVEHVEKIKKHGGNVVRTPQGSNIVLLAYKGWGFAVSDFTDEEPSIATLNDAGLRHGFVIWTPWRKRFKPRGWYKTWFPILYAGKGVAAITPDYTKNWSPSARRDLKLFQRSGAVIMPSSREEFMSYLKHATASKNGREVSRLILKQSDDKNLIFWAAKKDDVLLGTLVVYNYAPHLSHHLVCYITPEGTSVRAGTGLIDMWFQYALRHNIKYLDFGHIRQNFEPREWAGFTTFKRKFLTQEIRIPYSFLKFF